MFLGLRITNRVVALLTGAALCAGAAPAVAQMELAVMVGYVRDEAGQPLEGVSIRLQDLDRGREVSLKTDKNGRFYRRGLQAGEWRILVEKEGYQPIDDKLKLVAGVDRKFDFKLAKATPAGAEEFTGAVEAYNRGDYEAAAKGFEAAVAKAPDLPEIRVNLALAYFRQNRPADAAAQLEKAAALAPDNSRVLYQLGGAYIDMKEFARAIEAFEKGLDREKNPSDPITYEAMISLGSLYFADGRTDDAERIYERALKTNPEGAAAKLGLGKVAFNKGDVDRALTFFKDVQATAAGTPHAIEAEAFIAALLKKTG